MASSQEVPGDGGQKQAERPAKKGKSICRLCREAGGICTLGYRKTHERSDPQCRLHGTVGGGQGPLRRKSQDKAPGGKLNREQDEPAPPGATERALHSGGKGPSRRSKQARRLDGPTMRAKLREILKVHVTWRRRPLRWSPMRGRHYDEALQRHHTDAEEDQLRGEHADRVRNKELYRKAVVVLRFLRNRGGSPSKFLDKVSSDVRWIDKVHDACWEKWGNNPPRAGGSEDYSEEILELSTPEWLDTEEGEAPPTTPPCLSSSSGEEEASGDVLLGEPVPTGTDTSLGEQIPVTPEWPWANERPPLPRRGELASHPRVYSGRVKEAWKVHSKLAFRAKRRRLRQQNRWRGR